MELSIRAIKISRPILLIVSVIGLIGIAFFSYSIFTNLQSLSGIFSKLTAVILPVAQAPQPPEGIVQNEGAGEALENLSQDLGVKKYTETARKGEGTTHLARRTLKSYLKDNLQSFQVTAEHKVYIEDYLAKKMGGQGLKLGQAVEFSEELLKEAIQKAETLTSQQLENLTQFSQLVPSLNY